MTKEQKILLLFVLAIAGGGAVYYVTQSGPATSGTDTAIVETTTTQTGTKTPTTPTTPVPAAPGNTSTKTITETVSYSVPENHQEEMVVVATVDSNGTLIDVKVSSVPTNKESRGYYGAFSNAFKPSLVTGKNISSISVSRIGGASLTTGAFNKALGNISAKL
jgi:hypothetical protein